MSVKVMARVWDSSGRAGTKLLTLLALADFSDDNGQSYPSLTVLARKVRLGVRQVCHILKSLEKAGEVHRTRSTGGRNRRTHYTILPAQNCETGNSVMGNSVTGNTEVQCQETVLPTSHALNHHRTVNKSASRKKRERADTDPRVKTLITAFFDKYLAKVGSRPVITKKDAGSLQRLLTAGHDVPAVVSAMDRYFATEFYSKTGFDAAIFANAFNRLNSAGARKRNYEDGVLPEL